MENRPLSALELCHARNLQIIPYGPAWWIVGDGVSRVVADLAGVQPCDLEPVTIYER